MVILPCSHLYHLNIHNYIAGYFCLQSVPPRGLQRLIQNKCSFIFRLLVQVHFQALNFWGLNQLHKPCQSVCVSFGNVFTSHISSNNATANTNAFQRFVQISQNKPKFYQNKQKSENFLTKFNVLSIFSILCKCLKTFAIGDV